MLEKVGQCLKVGHRVTMWPSKFQPRYLSKRIYVHTITYKRIFRTISFVTAQKWKHGCPSADGQHSVVCPYNEPSFGNKNEWCTLTCYTMDRTWKYYAKWKKAATKATYSMIPFIRNVQRDRK